MGDIIKIGEGKFERIWQERCPHKHLLYDTTDETIRCSDCKRPINPFQAFMQVVRQFDAAQKEIDRRTTELHDLEQRSERGLLKATQTVDRAWRKKRMVPTCPHCHVAIFPEDGLGNAMQNREMAIEQRKFRKRTE